MKRFRFSIILMLFGTILFGQEKLRVEYEIIPTYEPAVKEAGMTMNAIKSYYELIMDKEESQYDYIEKVNNEQSVSDGGMVASFEMRSDGTLYKNTKDKIWIEDTNFENKAYLIKDSLKKMDWKISKETKEIAGFQVQKATVKLDDKYKTDVTAWYAPKLNFKNGPDKFWGLPGLILEVETKIEYEDGGSEGTKYTAIKVEAFDSDKKIKIPQKGEEISQKAYQKMQEEYEQKMMEMYGSGVDKD